MTEVWYDIKLNEISLWTCPLKFFDNYKVELPGFYSPRYFSVPPYVLGLEYIGVLD
jgi:hypothetical protein